MDTTTEDFKNIKFHECTEIFQMLDREEIIYLAKDIRKNGQIESIKLFDGQIIDGRGRYLACLEIGVTPRFEDVDVKNVADYIISMNISRRHLDTSQRAWAASNLAEKLHIMQEDAAKVMKVSPRSLASAVKVKRKAVPELIAAVQKGEISISAAEKIANFSADQQLELLSLPEKMRRSKFRHLNKLNRHVRKVKHNIRLELIDSQYEEIEQLMLKCGRKDMKDFLSEIIKYGCKGMSESLPSGRLDI